MLMLLVHVMAALAPVPVARGYLDEHLDFLGERVELNGGVLRTVRDVAAGEPLLAWDESCCLTARNACVDTDLGPMLRELAPRTGPGFETVALGAFLAAERVRNFRVRVGLSEAVASRGQLVPSEWSELAGAMWAMDSPPVTAELEPLIVQAVDLLLPSLDLVARRSWSAVDNPVAPRKQPGAAAEPEPEPAAFSAAWVRARQFDDAEGWSRYELRELLAGGLARVLAYQRFPPALIADGAAAGEPSARWGWVESAPTGPALLPLVDALTGAAPSEEANAVLGCPSRPEVGVRDAGVCLKCVAARDLAAGERVVAVELG